MSSHTISRRGIARGAVLASVVGVTASVLARYMSADAGANTALSVVLLAGFVAGGFAAGREAPRFAFTNGALAALAAFVAVEVAGILSLVARGEAGKINPFNVVFLGLLVVSCGLVGGAIAASLDQRRLARENQEEGPS